MNSVRIAVVGILVEFYGIEMAQGFYHDFEGWAIFVACIVGLFALMWLMAFVFVPKKDMKNLLHAEIFIESNRRPAPPEPQTPAPLTAFATVGIILLVAVATNTFAAQRAEAVPERPAFATFPLKVDSWEGKRSSVLASIINALEVDDFIVADYRRPEDKHAVNLYMAYRSSLRERPFVHSPQNCLPGGGWQISSIEDRVINAPSLGLDKFRVKSAIIKKGDERRLVYYWFQHRGRHLTSNVPVKWYLFWDSLTRNRTDGSLIRLITKLDDVESTAVAEDRIIKFLGAFRPQFSRYLPSGS
jgi:exosortase D (VPLPA-CTERM-specific)